MADGLQHHGGVHRDAAGVDRLADADLVGADEADTKGAKVTGIIGQVFDVQKASGTTAVQLWTDPKNSDGNVIVILPSDATVPDDGDYLKVSGTVADVFKGKNAFGATVEAPRLAATNVEPVTAAALDPAVKTYEDTRTKTLPGVSITVRRVELAKANTRVEVRYANTGTDDYSPSVSLTADGEQVETSYEDGGEKAPADTVSSGATSSGVLTFDAVDPSSTLRLVFDGYDANYDKVIAKFTYTP